MAVKIFFCYAHEDENLLNKLKTHLKPLQRQGAIEIWHDRDISAGTEWEQEISKQLNAAQIILLLVSPDFMASEYCYGIEMQQALERHERGEAFVVPVILRHVYWQGVLGQLQALPKDAIPVTDPDWYNLDRALHNVTEGILIAVEKLTNRPNDLILPPVDRISQDQSSPRLDVESPIRQSTEPIPPTELTTQAIHTSFPSIESAPPAKSNTGAYGKSRSIRPLERNYIFEFAGMPQSGKTTVKEIVAHYLKRMEYPVVEFIGGPRYSGFPINHMPIEALNEKLAQRIKNYVRSIMEGQNTDHNIHLLDRGLIDKCIFTDALARDNKISREEAGKIYDSLTIPELLERLDGVYIFVTLPGTALAREYTDKLVEYGNVRSKGDVMDELFLREMRSASEDWYKEISRGRYSHVRYIEFIDTGPLNTDIVQVARYVLEKINKQFPELELELKVKPNK